MPSRTTTTELTGAVPPMIEDQMSQFRWYAVYTYPRHEKKVLDQLVLRKIESFLPYYRALHKWRNGCRVEVRLPLFPGYLFVRIRLQDRVRVLQVPGLLSLIGFGASPVPLATEEIQRLKTMIETMKSEPHPFLKMGDRVRVKSGCLAGFEGIFIRKANGFRFVLNVDLIKQAASIEMSAEEVEPIASSLPASSWHV